jgi:outer membrane protein OmpA-like peptidoglycan-associated protein
MTVGVIRAAWVAVVLAMVCHGAASQPAPPSTNDIIDALSRSTKDTSRGFRLNQGAASPAPDTAGSGGAHRGTGQPRASRREIGVPLLFDLDSATLKPDSAPMIASMAKALNSPRLADSRILLEGHTDASGTAPHNMALSEQRAQSVKAALVQEGVDGARLSTIGKGQSDPANPADPLAAENRRVVLVNVSGPAE